ncbi:MAG: putative sulfate exporter family transporter [Candidatus Dormibacteria bacterium]
MQASVAVRQGPPWIRGWVGRLAAVTPGLTVVAACVAVSYALSARFPLLSPLIWAVFVGMAVVSVRPLSPRLRPGVQVASRQLLRLGVGLLGLRLAFGQLVSVGAPGLVVILLVVPVTIGVTLWLGRRLGCPPGLSLLVGTGSAICGASAIVAMDAVAGTDEDDVTFAVATVTLFGTLALVALPLLDRGVLHLSATAYGTWAGASVHEVAQVVAAATPEGSTAVKVATIVKLTRVLMLAPLVLAVSLMRRRSGAAVTGRQSRVPVPLFVLGFLVCVGIASAHVLPTATVTLATQIDAGLLTAALAGLGLGVHIRQIVRLGWRPMVLGLGAWAAAAFTALAGCLVLVR